MLVASLMLVVGVFFPKHLGEYFKAHRCINKLPEADYVSGILSSAMVIDLLLEDLIVQTTAPGSVALHQ